VKPRELSQWTQEAFSWLKALPSAVIYPHLAVGACG